MGAPNRSKLIIPHALSLQVVEAATAAVRDEARRCAMRGVKLGLVAQRRLYERVSRDTAIRLCHGSHTDAARVLGISRRCMYYLPKTRESPENDPTLIQSVPTPSWSGDTPKTQPWASQVAKRANGWRLEDLDPEAVEVARGLMVSVLRNIPGCALSFCSVAERERKLLNWSLEVAKLHHVDRVPYTAIKFLAQWSQRDKAWLGRIVTGKALRKLWDQLQAAYEAQRESFERRRAG